MFGKFNEESRKVLTLAKEEMSKLKHPFVGSEHLLLGILSLNNDLTKRLKKYGLTYKVFKEELINVVGIGKEGNDWFLFTPLLKRILERVVIDSKDTNDEITCFNLFMSIINEGEGVAYRLLLGLGIDLDKIVTDFSSERKKKNKKLLIEEIGIDLNKEAEKNKIDPVYGREDETNRLIEILCRRTKNNPILVGNAGVGKTAIVENLARRIVNYDVPSNLLNKRIISIDMASLLSGTKYRGEFEEKLKKIINELINNEDIILFVDEIHTLVGAGSAEGAIDASNILKPFLARGLVKIIGSTTLTEYNKSIEKDKALERRFQKVLVEEPNKNNLKRILMGLKEIYESYHGVVIEEKIIDEIINLSRKYIYDRYEPDKSIDILDEVSSKVSLKEIESEKGIIDINKNLEKLKKKKDNAIKKEDYQLACSIKDKELFLLKEKNILELEVLKKKKIKKVTINDVREVISKKTGIPIIVEENDLFDNIKRIENKLKNSIIGQNQAIDNLIEITKKIKLGIKEPNKSYSILFSGSSGVGKTFLAKKYASLITNNVIKIDMNEYSLKESINKLIGSPSGYIGYDDNKNILESIRINPYSVLILDELEKAHPSIINFFLNILDEGYCFDNKGNKIRFDNVIIIMTTNEIIKSNKVGFISNNKTNINTFSKEFLNRIDEIINFNNPTDSDINRLIYSELDKYNKRHRCNLKLELNEINIIKEKSDISNYGIRRLSRNIKKELDNKLIEKIFI